MSGAKKQNVFTPTLRDCFQLIYVVGSVVAIIFCVGSNLLLSLFLTLLFFELCYTLRIVLCHAWSQSLDLLRLGQ